MLGLEIQFSTVSNWIGDQSQRLRDERLSKADSSIVPLSWRPDELHNPINNAGWGSCVSTNQLTPNMVLPFIFYHNAKGRVTRGESNPKFPKKKNIQWNPEGFGGNSFEEQCNNMSHPDNKTPRGGHLVHKLWLKKFCLGNKWYRHMIF